MTALILVVNDDPAQRRQIKAALEGEGHSVQFADNGKAALDAIRQNPGEIKTVLLDLAASAMEAGEFLSSAISMDADLPVIVQTGQNGLDQAVEAMRAGAFDFVVSPVEPDRIAGAIANALKLNGREGAGKPARRSRSGNVSFTDIISASAAMARVIDLARRAAHSTIPVVLEGECGVGKQLVARAIHSGSDRSSKPFVAVNCSAVAPEIIDGLLFGPERDDVEEEGPQSGGKFAAADGGTLFLDEIGALPPSVQAKLLRAVQHGEIEQLNGRKRRKFDVRLISSTRKDLIEEVKAGRFREDLYYRLNVYPITIAALRRRRDDIPYLARAFVERFSAEQRLTKPLGLTPGALALLTGFEWPGNVRQLENALFRAVILATGPELSESDFPQIVAQMPAEFGGGAKDMAMVPGIAGNPANPFAPAAADIREPARSASANPALLAGNIIVSTDNNGNVRKLAEVEEELIRFALKFYRGQMSQVARKLGIGRSTLYRKLKDYDIDPENPQKDAA